MIFVQCGKAAFWLETVIIVTCWTVWNHHNAIVFKKNNGTIALAAWKVYFKEDPPSSQGEAERVKL